VATVIGFTVASAAGFVLGTLLFLPNVLPLVLSVPVLLFLLAYSLTKRFTSLSSFLAGRRADARSDFGLDRAARPVGLAAAG
jgi:4-hydroxybenzoate polyprenyltransferase